MVPRRAILVGLDLGTTSVKAAAWSPEGERLAAARRPAPPLVPWRGLEVQDPEALARVGEAVVAQVLADAQGSVHPAGVRFGALAFTTQRDTLLLLRPDGGPATPLLSWRVRHHLEDPEARGRLLGREAGGAPRLRSLEGWLLERWGERWGRGFPLPGGAQDGGGAPPPPCYAGGDKNCEYLALGARPEDPGTAVLSLGSAVSLGVAVGDAGGPHGTRGAGRGPGAGGVAPSLPPGVVASPLAGGAPGWNLETGILSGMDGRALAAELVGVDPWEGDLPFPEVESAPAATVTATGSKAREGPGLRPPRPSTAPSLFEGPVVVPHFGGALDDPSARARLVGEGAPPDSAQAARAWARGVALELARLRPRLEAASGVPLRRVVVGGGGASDPAWIPLLRQALELPVEGVPDPWAGCRGALLATGFPVAPDATSETSPPGDG